MRILNSRTVIIFLASVLALISINSYAKDVAPYFDKSKISPLLIDSPALSGSRKYEKEVQYVIRIQQNPDAEEVKQAFVESHLIPEMISQSVSKGLARQEYPRLYHLLDRVYQTSKVVNARAKYYWNIPRPYVAIKDIKALIDARATPSYPSGHTTEGYVIARVLSMIFPEKKKEFLARANEIANHRVLVGMHLPQDLVAGRELSLLVIGSLVQNKNFLKDLKKAKKEVADIDK